MKYRIVKRFQEAPAKFVYHVQSFRKYWSDKEEPSWYDVHYHCFPYETFQDALNAMTAYANGTATHETVVAEIDTNV